MADLVPRTLKFKLRRQGRPLARIDVLFTPKGLAPADNFILTELSEPFQTDNNGEGSAALYVYEDSYLNYYVEFEGNGGQPIEFTLADELGDAHLGELLDQAIQSEDLRLHPATVDKIGAVKPDGTTITIDSDGTIHAVGGELTGPAGGVLSGNFPNPGFAVNMVEQTELESALATKADLVSGKVPTAQLPTTDSLTEGVTKKFFTEPRVLSTLLAGLGAGSDTPITATDSVKSAFENLQNQILNLSGFTPEWSPFDLGSKLNLWIEPRLGGMKNAANGAAADGEKIATLTEFVFSDNFIQTDDSKRPKYIARSAYSDQPCIRVDSTQQFLTNSVWNRWNNLNSQCWVIVYKPKANSPAEMVVPALVGDGHQGFRVTGANNNISVGTYEPASATFGGAFASNGGLMLAAIHDGSLSGNSNRIKLYKNKNQVAQTSISFNAPSQYNPSAPGLSFFGRNDGNESGQGDYYLILHLNAAPTADELNQIHAYAEKYYFAKVKKLSRAITEGDSRTKGYYANTPVTAEYTYPTILARMLGGNSFHWDGNIVGTFDENKLWNIYNFGTEGDQMTTGIGGTDQTAQILALRDEWLKNDVVAVFAGINDYTGNKTGAQVEAAFSNYGTQLKNAGFKLIINTEIGNGTNSDGQPPLTGGQQTQRDNGNNLLIANWQNYADYLMRFDLNLRLARAVHPSNYFDFTCVHLSPDGNEAVANLVLRAIKTIGSF